MNWLAVRLFVSAFLWLVPVQVFATDLYPHDNWSALASDRSARKAGDILTIIVYETSMATDSATSTSNRNISVDGRVSAQSLANGTGSLALANRANGAASTGRNGQMVAQISAVVDEVLPNGDLRVSGAQELKVNGERTFIRVKGRVRAVDVTASNIVLSSRLTDAAIDYDGSGFVSRGAMPGLVARIFSWLGIP
jgi:flagellar L-ring protein precursor FlgH